MKNKLVISIIIPCYNHGKYLQEAIKSVEENKSTYPVEIIIVNDGSTDKHTLTVIKQLENEGYHIINQENKGLPVARNNGIKIAKGKYILPLDSDNKILTPYLNDAVDILESNKNIDIVYGNAKYIGEKSGTRKNTPINIDKMLYSNHIDACAIFRKSVWEKVNGYSEDMPYMGVEDWNFWLKCINAKCNFYYLNKECFEYRVLSTSMIRNTPEDFYQKSFEYNLKTLSSLYANYLKENGNKLESIFYGSLIRRLTKLTLNYFGLYKY